ncbi:hypothetical protein FB451DRAFT_147462 [Mycena latifolia]|nr:hypothetical protein FB451DRAFT_147462 [Mycena latifolia]
MDSRRAQTLEALASFIEQQRALLARTQSDLEALRRLKTETVADVGSLADQLSGSAFRLSEQADCESKVPEGIDWGLFAQKDPKPLQHLAQTARTTHAQRHTPSATQRSELSDLQKFVKEARRTILDPVLAVFGEKDEEPAPGTLDAVPTSPKDLKKRALDECGALATPRMPPRGPSGLFTRRPRVKIDVDVDTTASTTAIDSESNRGALSSTTSPLCRSPPSPTSLPMALAKPVRTRRISTKLQHQNLDRSEPLVTRSRRKSSTAAHTVKQEPKPEPEPEPMLPPSPPPPPSPAPAAEDAPRTVLGKRQRKSSTKKTDTYKVVWSASEQNLLERLLEEIPQSDPRRYQKISIAMNGRRTPRQVSSRVQKYLQKLKKFGIESK